MKKYSEAFDKAFDSLRPGETISVGTLLELPGLPSTQLETRKRNLGAFLVANPRRIDRLSGWIPPAQAIVARVELELGTVDGTNLGLGNRLASELVARLVGPMVEAFIEQELRHYTNDGRVQIDFQELATFLTGGFSTFLGERARGLVSIAGAVNHELLIRSLAAASLRAGDDYKKTGNKSQGDIIVYSAPKGRPKGQLGVEVKSYHARERLLRGLMDIEGPKVGAGFFKKATEFGERSTRALLQTGAAAVYLPRETLAEIDTDVRSLTANAAVAAGKPFYRALDTFPTDMSHFCSQGVLP